MTGHGAFDHHVQQEGPALMPDGFLERWRQLFGTFYAAGGDTHGLREEVEAQLGFDQVHAHELAPPCGRSEIVDHVQLQDAIGAIAEHDEAHGDLVVRGRPQRENDPLPQLP